MSELIAARPRADFRLRLFGTVSALTLLIAGSSQAKADDSDRPTVWIELGGQLSRLSDGQKIYTPDFLGSPSRPSIFSPSTKFERPPRYSVDGYGALSFHPKETPWTFSASIHYGRAVTNRHVRQQTYPDTAYYPSGAPVPVLKNVVPLAAQFADTRARNAETHAIVDFAVGKDVGLGLFGTERGSSAVSVGVRFAQFESKSNIALASDPDWHAIHKIIPPLLNFHTQAYHSNAAAFLADRNFHGVGPALSWNASLPFAGNSESGKLALDWGLNAAVLFGRQKAQAQHELSEQYNYQGNVNNVVNHRVIRVDVAESAPPASIRSHDVTVPNVGGFAGASVDYRNAKVSLGYRADFFFGAMDGGIDARETENRGFYGPYATISIGLGG